MEFREAAAVDPVTAVRNLGRIPNYEEVPPSWLKQRGAYRVCEPTGFESLEAVARQAGFSVRLPHEWTPPAIIDAVVEFRLSHGRWPEHDSRTPPGGVADYQASNGLPSSGIAAGIDKLRMRARTKLYELHPEYKPTIFDTKDGAVKAILDWTMTRDAPEGGWVLPNHRDFVLDHVEPGLPDWPGLRDLGIRDIMQLRDEVIQMAQSLDIGRQRMRALSVDGTTLQLLSKSDTAALRADGDRPLG